MMLTVRNNTFETNSSSVHAISLNADNIGDGIHTIMLHAIELGEQGSVSAGDYLYTAAITEFGLPTECNNELDEWKDMVQASCNAYGVNVIFSDEGIDNAWIDDEAFPERLLYTIKDSPEIITSLILHGTVFGFERGDFMNEDGKYISYWNYPWREQGYAFLNGQCILEHDYDQSARRNFDA